jgi:AcrR family transcriptional regulator
MARERIITAARRRFVEDGYASASMSGIADDAQVSRRTVYDAFGTKNELLKPLPGRMAPLPQDEFEAALDAAVGDAHVQLSIAIDFITRYYDGGTDVLAMVHAAAGADPDLAELDRMGESFRRMAQRPLIEDWGRRGLLAGGLSRDNAADILWSMTAPHVYRLFVSDCGWTRDAFARWLRQALAAQLLAQPLEPGDEGDPPASEALT